MHELVNITILVLTVDIVTTRADIHGWIVWFWINTSQWEMLGIPDYVYRI